MGAQGLTITPVKQGEATILKVEGESAGTLIGHRGEVMEALSYLTSLVANRAGGDYMKIGLDIQARGKPDSAGKAHRREGGPHGPRPHAGAHESL